jgi:drug/metabolite transporter (DMT)-like permease
VELIGVAMTTGGITAVVGEREAQNETVTVAGASGLLADAAEAPTKAGGGSESGRDSDGEPASRGDVESGGRLEIEGEKPESSDRSNTGRARRLRGALFALGGALGQASGLVLSRVGVGSYDPFAATQIRGIAGIIGFSLIFTAFRKWKDIAAALRNAEAMRRIGLGAFFGPFLGVSLSLLAVQNTTAGIASTIMALVPVLIIPPAALFFREKIRVKEVIAALVAVAGVSLLFLT